MLEILIPAIEFWDEKNNEFITTEEYKLQLEHSLVSLSKWESKWCKPFFSKADKTDEETFDYIKCMSIDQNIDNDILLRLTKDHYTQISEYIADPMTATWFREEKHPKSSAEQVTSELIYYKMIALGIPFECQYWHLNRLTTLIRVCDVKSQPPKKTSRKEILSQNAALNAERKQKLNTKG